MNKVIYTCIFIILLLIVFIGTCSESFNISSEASSPWDWNVSTSYHAGDTGYGLYGVWPAHLSKEPWKWWMWGRRPSIFYSPFTEVPQIDYNSAKQYTKPLTNIDVQLRYFSNKFDLFINGKPRPIITLDVGRDYYFHIYTPNNAFVITDGKRDYTRAISVGTIRVNFDRPMMLFYTLKGRKNVGGILYVNPIRANV